jgi:hypothetical protein
VRFQPVASEGDGDRFVECRVQGRTRPAETQITGGGLDGVGAPRPPAWHGRQQMRDLFVQRVIGDAAAVADVFALLIAQQAAQDGGAQGVFQVRVDARPRAVVIKRAGRGAERY